MCGKEGCYIEHSIALCVRQGRSCPWKVLQNSPVICNTTNVVCVACQFLSFHVIYLFSSNKSGVYAHLIVMAILVNTLAHQGLSSSDFFHQCVQSHMIVPHLHYSFLKFHGICMLKPKTLELSIYSIQNLELEQDLQNRPTPRSSVPLKTWPLCSACGRAGCFCRAGLD